MKRVNDEPRNVRTLRKMRLDAGLTVAGLARVSGVSASMISNVENQSKNLSGVRAETVEKLCFYVGASELEELAALYSVRRWPTAWEEQALSSFTRYRKAVAS
jgi:transcriptional regulator with XRE-family HTH domain